MPGPPQPGSPSALDDAGKPLPLVPPHLQDDAARSTRPPLATWIFQRIFPLIALGILAFTIYQGAFSLRGILLALGLGALLGAAMLIASIIAARFARKDNKPQLLPTAIAWTAAHRHCGCCAYSLHEIPPDARGLATCPECGAAWHRDRWTLAHRPLQLSIEQRLGRPDPSLASDDRGVLLDTPPQFPPRWIENPDARQAARPLLEAHRRARAKRIRFGAPILLLTWPILTALAVWKSDPMPRDFAADVAFMGVPIGGIHAALAWLLWRAGPGWKSQRARVLALGLCPSCGVRLPTGAPGFDACTACPSCGRAWQTTAIAPPPVPPDPPLSNPRSTQG